MVPPTGDHRQTAMATASANPPSRREQVRDHRHAGTDGERAKSWRPFSFGIAEIVGVRPSSHAPTYWGGCGSRHDPFCVYPGGCSRVQPFGPIDQLSSAVPPAASPRASGPRREFAPEQVRLTGHTYVFSAAMQRPSQKPGEARRTEPAELHHTGAREAHDQCGVGDQPVADPEDRRSQRTGLVRAVPRFSIVELPSRASGSAHHGADDRPLQNRRVLRRRRTMARQRIRLIVIHSGRHASACSRSDSTASVPAARRATTAASSIGQLTGSCGIATRRRQRPSSAPRAVLDGLPVPAVLRAGPRRSWWPRLRYMRLDARSAAR